MLGVDESVDECVDEGVDECVDEVVDSTDVVTRTKLPRAYVINILYK